MQCLDLGADDYLVKAIFLHRTFGAHSRSAAAEPSAGGVGAHGGGSEARPGGAAGERAGRRIELTSKEFSLLEYLMRNAGGASPGP